LIGGSDEEPILRDHADEMLISRAEQIGRERRQDLRPGKSRAARECDDVACRIDRVQRPVGTKGRLLDADPDRVHATAPEIERQEIVFGGRDKEELGFGVEADDALDGGQFALQHSLDGREPRQPVELGCAAFSGQSDRDARRPGENLKLANPLRRLLL
jgi:hypothetical protein